jgi:hypothetical protein
MAGPIDTGLLVRGLAALEDAVSALRDQLAATTARADRLDLLVETERGRIVTIEAKAVAAEQGRDRAEAQAAELRALLEQAEAAAEKARREAVHEARQAAQGPPGAAQGGVARGIAILQAQLAQLETEGVASDVQAAELTAQLKQARAEAQESAHAAAELEQAEAARRARGLLARLRAAWRGE